MKNYKTFYENTILDNIDFDGYGLTVTDNFGKVKETHSIFKREYDHEIKRQGEVKAFAEWLRGLPSVLTVPFYYHEILSNGAKWVQENKDKGLRAAMKKEDKFLDEYWDKLAVAFFTLKDNL